MKATIHDNEGEALSRRLISEASVAFDSLNARNEAGANLPPSTTNIYKAASLLFQINNKVHSNVGNNNITIVQLNGCFEALISSIDDDYLSNVILNDLYDAFDKLTERAKSSLEDLAARSNSMAKEDLEHNLSQCFSAVKPFQIIFGHVKCSKQQSRCCKLGFRRNNVLAQQLVFLHDVASQCRESYHDTEEQNIKDFELSSLQTCILNTLSSLLLNSITSISSQSTDEDDAIQSTMTLLQSISSEQSSTCFGDVLQWQQDYANLIDLDIINDGVKHTDVDQNAFANCCALEKVINFVFADSIQKEYLLQMLSTAKKSTPKSTYKQTSNHPSTANAVSKGKGKAKNKPQISGLDRIVSQIKGLFPMYGEGYIEAALACHNNDLERTTVALLEVQSDPNSRSIHPRLRALDTNLPSRRKATKERYDEEDTKEDLEAKAIQKARNREIEIQEENEAFLLEGAMGEYNDDYDDQYDGVGDDIGGADSGLYDMDYEQTKAYNKARMGMEEDRKFWEESRNTNRKKSKPGKRGKVKNNEDNNSDDDDVNESDGSEKKFRGPDKGKGGRLIGPDGRYLPYAKPKKQQNQSAAKNVSKDKKDNQSGSANGAKQNGGKPNGGSDNKKKDSENMTKIQKRRKNDNKSKIGNHHRKERAMKKNAM